MQRSLFLLTLIASAAFAQTNPLKDLIDAARSNNTARLKELLASGLPQLQGRDGAAVWGQEFLFAV